jgi:hypothetical protein
MNQAQSEHWSFAFNIDPVLNSGYTRAFKQGNEPWWWYSDELDGDNSKEGPAAGPPPDFTGATFAALHQWDKQVL